MKKYSIPATVAVAIQSEYIILSGSAVEAGLNLDANIGIGIGGESGTQTPQ